MSAATASKRRSEGSGDWGQKDLVGLQGVEAAALRGLLTRARGMLGNQAVTPTLAGRNIANLFFEDSTRTRTSFTVAAQRLGAAVANLSAQASSLSKGETLIDTARNVEAMGVAALVVRAKQAGAAAAIARAVACPVINAGDGKHEHPTQALLDIYTLAEARGRLETFDLSGLTVAIVGDIVSSRVARSNLAGMTTLGATVVCVGPAGLAPKALEALAPAGRCRVTNDLDSVLPEADAVMMLRVQFERHGGATPAGGEMVPKSSPTIASIREYRAFFGMTAERAGRLKAGAVVMHPGPINRGLELDPEVADGAQSVILRQVAVGVGVRMAVLDACCNR